MRPNSSTWGNQKFSGVKEVSRKPNQYVFLCLKEGQRQVVKNTVSQLLYYVRSYRNIAISQRDADADKLSLLL